MPKLGAYGSVRGALSNERPYRDPVGLMAIASGALLIDPLSESSLSS